MKTPKYEYAIGISHTKTGGAVIGCKTLDDLIGLVVCAALDKEKPSFRVWTAKEAKKLGILPNLYCLGPAKKDVRKASKKR